MYLCRIISALFAILIAFQPGPALAAQVATDPSLRIEAGMHIAPILSIATDAANRFVVTGSEDKTVRVWSLPGGRPAGTLRIPVGSGSVGKVYAVALSPDGTTVAVGGWTTSAREEQIYLLDRRSGALQRRLTGLADVTTSLAFSPDGRFLVAGLGGRNGILVYDVTQDWHRIAADTTYDGAVQGLAFDPAGRLATAGGDGILRVYAAGQYGKPVRTSRRLDGRPRQLAFSPDGTRLAVAFDDRPKVAVLSPADLMPLFTPNLSGLASEAGGFFGIAWSAGGEVLMAGGSIRISNDYWLRRWSGGGRGTYVDLPAANDAVRQLLPLRDGEILFATMDPSLGVVTPTGAVHVLQGAGRLDFRARVGAGLMATARGDAVDIGVVFPLHRLGFSLTDRAATLDQGVGADFSPPHLAALGLSVTGWRDGRSPALNGVPLPLERGETVRSLAVEPDGNGFVLGTSWRIVRFDAAGRKLWSKPTEGVVWQITVPLAGRMVIAAQGDGTIRWRRLSDGQELLAAFVTPDARRWVAWTPGGYYDASPGGESLIGWQVDHGADASPSFHATWQFRDRFYRPDVIPRVLESLDEAAALGTVKVPTAPISATVVAAFPPSISILEAPDEATEPRIELTYALAPESIAAESVTIEATIDGRKITPVYQGRQPGGLGVVGLIIPEDIPDKTLEVALFASDRNGRSEPATTQVRWYGGSAQQRKPVLHILAVGISKYAQPKSGLAALTFPALDAAAFAAAMQAQHGLLYSQVESHVMVDEQATLANIRQELRRLRKQMAERDVAMVFLSGHGAPPTEDWAFEPYDSDFEDEETRLSGEELDRLLTALPGIKVLFLDSCFSGAALRDRGLAVYRSPRDINRLINILTTAPTGIVVFASSTADQRSWENPVWQHGAYTKALLEGLEGAAGRPRISMYALQDYLDRRVRDLTQEKQTPTMTASYGMPSITLAIISEDRR